MFITAHGGSLKTSRNSHYFMKKIADYNVDIIEVDIRKFGKLLYLSHLPTLFPYFTTYLRYAFKFISQYNFKINCDVKKNGLVKPVLDLAKEMGVADRIIFTGKISPEDIKYLDAGEVYLNKTFFKLKCPRVKDVKWMKEYIDSFNNPRISGLNLKYIFVTDEFIEECNKYNLPISAFVVDDVKEMIRLFKHTKLANFTTNIPDVALEMLELINK